MGALKGCLESVLRQSALAPEPDKRGTVTLREKRERGRAAMSVQVTRVPPAATVVSLGRASQHPILRQSQGQSWLRICDYAVFVEHENHCEVVMVELKTTLQKRSDGLEQLRRSLPLAKYLLSVCEVELTASWPCRFGYALLAEKHTNRLSKGRVRPSGTLEATQYEGIDVAVAVGDRFDFGDLTSVTGAVGAR